MKEYLIINLDDFHKNQKGSETYTQIRFIKCDNVKEVKDFVKRWYPETAWVSIDTKYFDNHIIYKENK